MLALLHSVFPLNILALCCRDFSGVVRCIARPRFTCIYSAPSLRQVLTSLMSYVMSLTVQ